MRETYGVLNLKWHCAEWSVYDIKVQREPYSRLILMRLNRSRGTVMSYTDHSAQHRFKSNTPIQNVQGRRPPGQD